MRTKVVQRLGGIGFGVTSFNGKSNGETHGSWDGLEFSESSDFMV